MYTKLPGICAIFIIGFINGIVSLDAPITQSPTNRSNCYAEAVYEELLRAIDIITQRALNEEKTAASRKEPSPLLKKLQEDEDDGEGGITGGGGLGGIVDFSFVPTIFKIVGSALSLNSSGLVENSNGIIPPGLSNQLTSVLGTLATNILGPGAVPTSRRPPIRRRRRTTTTIAPEEVSMIESNDTMTMNNETMALIDMMLELNITDTDMNITDTDIEIIMPVELEEPSTTEVLFKESALGELPVYAAAYAPNYVATTTFPVYANKFLHVLYPAPTTTTTTTSTTTATTSTDPNSYAVELPFDYQELVRTTPFVPPDGNLIVNMNQGNATDYDYEEYESEQEEITEENKTHRYRQNGISDVTDSPQNSTSLPLIILHDKSRSRKNK